MGDECSVSDTGTAGSRVSQLDSSSLRPSWEQNMMTLWVKCDLRHAGSGEGRMYKVGVKIKKTSGYKCLSFSAAGKTNVLILSSPSQQCYECLLPSALEMHESVWAQGHLWYCLGGLVSFLFQFCAVAGGIPHGEVSLTPLAMMWDVQPISRGWWGIWAVANRLVLLSFLTAECAFGSWASTERQFTIYWVV